MRILIGCASILLLLFALAPTATAQEVEITEDTFALKLLAADMTSPIYLVEAPDNSDRLFVVDQIGVIWVIDSTGDKLSTPFLDLRDRVVELMPAFDERGLLGLAFHPDFATNGRFFVYYNAPPRPETPAGYDHIDVIAEFHAAPGSNDAHENTERRLLVEDHPQFNHNGGTIAFGPDGYLYISIGDGGGGNDTGLGHVEDWYDENGGGNGQDVTQNLLGNVLRIDVDNMPDDSTYGIPEDNPFAEEGDEGLDEIWAFGLRNPYRFSFDMGGNHEMYLGDAGQELYEEVNIVVQGGNYGWNVKEGTHCFDAENPLNPPADCPEVDSAGNPLRDPIIEFPNSRNISDGLGLVVVGGFVYRGDLLDGHQGHYFFGTPTDTFGVPRGKVFMAEGTSDTTPDPALWKIEQLVFEGHADTTTGNYVLGFGQDMEGELYVLANDVLGPTGTTGKVYLLTFAEQDTIPDTTDIDTLVTPTDQWISIYCGDPMLDSVPLMPGDTIAVFDDDGVLSGIGLVRSDGSFGFIPVYRDDTTSHDIDEGADPGDILRFEINGDPVTPENPVIWTELGDRIEVCNFTSGAGERCIDIPLHNGWNVISWNVAYSDSITRAFADIMDCIGVVHGFDQTGLTFDPKKLEFSTLWEVDYFHGYAIRIVGNECQDDTLTICGPPIEDEGIPINEGWNLISYWPQESLAPEDALVTIIDNLLIAYTFDQGVKMFRPEHPGFQTLDLMREGFGYWVKSSADDFLVYPGFGDGGTGAPPAFKRGNPIASRTWMSIYGKNLTLDGQPLPSGTQLAAYTSNGALCGSGVYANGILKFMPIFGRDNTSDAAKTLPVSGTTVYLTINDTPVLPALTWQEEGALVEVQRFFTGKIDGAAPASYSLGQNYPNPFNPSTQISFSLPAKSAVTLEIFNLVGQRVRSLVNGSLEAGAHSVTWDGYADDGTQVASGLYFYRLQTANFSETKKMLLMK